MSTVVHSSFSESFRILTFLVSAFHVFVPRDAFLQIHKNTRLLLFSFVAFESETSPTFSAQRKAVSTDACFPSLCIDSRA